MSKTLEVLFAPAEFAVLPSRDLSETVCVVFDILRATSTMITALANGARAVFPVGEIDEAMAAFRQHPEALLGGERHGLRILAAQTGGVDFHLGNSPREFLPEKVRDKTIISTTTNGTRALRACVRAQMVFVASFLNLSATAKQLNQVPCREVLLVCSGTMEQAALEDALAAGAFCDRIWSEFAADQVSDSARIARELYLEKKADLLGAVALARNGRRLLEIPELRDDVPYCLQRDVLDLVATLGRDGFVRKLD
ncbi:MAG: 2-phosphosulfolactate phosphatase [Verrucomicrobiota bacterium]